MPATIDEAAAPQRPAPVNMLGVFDKLSGPDVHVYQNRCVRVRNRLATCTACVDACTTGAIALDEEGRIAVTPSRCIGCGTCATVCPTCALESHHPTDDDLLASALAAAEANGGQAVFACAKVLDEEFGHIDESKVVRVTCLGRIEESLLVALAQAGVTDLRFVEGACATCDHVTGWEACREVTQTAESILDAWGAPAGFSYIDDLPAQVRAEGRFYADEPAAPAAPEAAKEPERTIGPGASAMRGEGEHFQRVGRDGTLPHFVPTRRGKLLSTLKQIGEAPEEQPVETRLWGEVAIDTEACGSCRLCAVFCPTGALRKFDDRRTATFGIEHEPGKCVACGTCVDICPKQAVTLVHEVFPSDLYDGHVERFEMRPREVEPGRPDTIVRKMRGLLTGSKYVNQA